MLITSATIEGRVSFSIQSGAGNEKSIIILRTPMTNPAIRPQKAPHSFILGHEIAIVNIMAIGGERYAAIDWM